MVFNPNLKQSSLFLSKLPNDILYNLSLFLIEPYIYINKIGWDFHNKYFIKYTIYDYNDTIYNYYNIIDLYIYQNYFNNIFQLYDTIFHLNTSFRQNLPTYIFNDFIFKTYPYITQNDLIKIEYDSSLNIFEKCKQIELIHINSLIKLKKKIITELNHYINEFLIFNSSYNGIVLNINNINFYNFILTILYS